RRARELTTSAARVEASSGRPAQPKLGAGLAVAHVDRRTHRRRELTHQREPDPRARGLAREAGLGAIEKLEDLPHLRFRHAVAEIAHRQQHAAVALAPARE